MAFAIRRAARKGRAGHDRHHAGRERPTDASGCGDRRRPHAPISRSPSVSTRPAWTTRCWCRRRRCRSWCRVRAFRPRCRSALVGGGDIEGALVKSGGLGFEGLDLELVDASRQGRRLPRAPISTASSCSSASPYGTYTRSDQRKDSAARREARGRSRRLRVDGHAPTSRSFGWARSTPTPVAASLAAAERGPSDAK